MTAVVTTKSTAQTERNPLSVICNSKSKNRRAFIFFLHSEIQRCLLCHDKSPHLQLPLMSMVFALKLLKLSGFLILQVQFLPLRPQGWQENLRSPHKDSFNHWKQYEATSLTKKVAQCALKSCIGCVYM